MTQAESHTWSVKPLLFSAPSSPCDPRSCACGLGNDSLLCSHLWRCPSSEVSVDLKMPLPPPHSLSHLRAIGHRLWEAHACELIVYAVFAHNSNKHPFFCSPLIATCRHTRRGYNVAGSRRHSKNKLRLMKASVKQAQTQESIQKDQVWTQALSPAPDSFVQLKPCSVVTGSVPLCRILTSRAFMTPDPASLTPRCPRFQG